VTQAATEEHVAAEQLGAAAEEVERRSHSGRAWLGLVVSVVALAGFGWWASRQEAPRIPTSAEALGELGLAVLVYALATVARGWRWHVLLRRSGVEHHALDAYLLVPVCYMGNTILPARGGEVLRMVLLANRSPARKREVGGAIIAERLLDAALLAGLFALLTFAGAGGTAGTDAFAWLAVGGLAAGVAGGAVALRMRHHPRLRALVERVRPIVRASVLLLRPVGLVLMLTTAGVWTLEGVVFGLVGRSLGIDLGLLDGLFLVVLASFFSLVPAAPGYVGTFDAAVVFGLKAIGVTGGVAVSFALVVRAVIFIPIVIAGLAIAVARYGGLGALRRTARTSAQ